MSNEGPFVDEAIIGELELHEGQRILYLFDYGDLWEFEIQLFKIINDEIPPEEPETIVAKEESSNQYSYYEDY